MRSFFLISILLAPADLSQCFAQTEPFDALRNGMQFHSDSLMHEFFEAWFQSSEAIRKKPVSALQMEAEELVETMWNPANYHALLWGWTADSIAPRQPPPYLVVWPVIKIYTDAGASLPMDSLENMLPSMLYDSKTLLYNGPFINSIWKLLNRRNPNHNADQEYLSKFVTISCHMGGCGVLGEPA
ncbi:MAG TPA: hypothetical protein VFD13_08730, partial [Candidatus Kapabacteria bacterium]|nr:hypothetical protein [Candidatus Kapabacteria bacterium]